MTWRSPYFVPCIIAWDPETGEFKSIEGPMGFSTWDEAEEADRFLSWGQLERYYDPRGE